MGLACLLKYGGVQAPLAPPPPCSYSYVQVVHQLVHIHVYAFQYNEFSSKFDFFFTMQLFHVMNLMTALVQNIFQYIVEDSAVPKQHLVTLFIMERNATHVLVSVSCKIKCIPLLLLPCL